MKIVFIVPSIKNNGGVARVTTLKANYFIENWNYQVAIICQDEKSSDSFFYLNSGIKLYYLSKNSGNFNYIFSYYMQVNTLLENLKPNAVIVGDNGFKGFMMSCFIKFKTNLVLEIHTSRFENINKGFSSATFLKNSFRFLGLKNYDKVIFLNEESAKEWNVANPILIPNPLPFKANKKSARTTKKVICIARHSHEKGLDRLLLIWSNVSKENSDWHLEIYGEETNYSKYLFELVDNYKIKDSVVFKQPIHNIEDAYLGSSVLVMTSRYEGFGLVLIEAMTCGLPVIAYDCPIGPKNIIVNNVSGFLIQDDNQKEFEEKLSQILKNQIDLSKIIQNGINTAENYNLAQIADKWRDVIVF